MREVIARAEDDASALAAAGFDAIMIENFGDSPFFPGRVPHETVAAMTAVVTQIRETVAALPLGINVLRNDGLSALGIAAATGAAFVRINVLVGAMVTDQGVIAGNAHEVARLRTQLCPQVRVLADVLVKHAQPLGPPPPLEQLVHDTVSRAMADALVVSGDGTGKPVSIERLTAVKTASSVPVYIGSGFGPKNAHALLSVADGAIIGSAIKRTSDPASPVDLKKAKALVAAARGA
jgi:membrane complex biogenesis BtpA family protein